MAYARIARQQIVIERQKKKLSSAEKILALSPEACKLGINQSEIIYVKADKNYCLLFMKDRSSQIIRITLKEVVQIMGEDKMVRIHRSYCVNEKYLMGVRRKNKNWFALCEEEELPISKGYLPIIKKRFNKYFDNV